MCRLPLTDGLSSTPHRWAILDHSPCQHSAVRRTCHTQTLVIGACPDQLLGRNLGLTLGTQQGALFPLLGPETLIWKVKGRWDDLNISCTLKHTILWEKISPPTLDRGLISKIYKELKKVVIRRTNNPI